MDKSDIIKIAKHVFKKGGGSSDHSFFNPSRDWLIGIFIFIIILLVGSYISGLNYARYHNVEVTELGTKTNLPKYNEVRVNEAILKYKSIDAKFKGLISETPNGTRRLELIDKDNVEPEPDIRRDTPPESYSAE